jgi:hypothetical protein
VTLEEARMVRETRKLAAILAAVTLALAARLDEAREVARKALELQPGFRSRFVFEIGLPPQFAGEFAKGARLLTTTGSLGLWAPGDSKPVRLAALPAATLSEILRAVDLLVSTSGFAVATGRKSATLVTDETKDHAPVVRTHPIELT